MKTAVSLICVTLAMTSLFTACAKDKSPAATPAPQSIASIEQEAALQGVTIAYAPVKVDNSNGQTYAYTPLVFGDSSLGNTDEELKAAIRVLRKYYAAINQSSDITEYDKMMRLKSIDEEMSRIAKKREALAAAAKAEAQEAAAEAAKAAASSANKL